MYETTVETTTVENVTQTKVTTVTETPTYMPQILLGVAMLTAHFRSLQWLDKIDLEKFRISSIVHCVIGQVFNEEGHRHGFDDMDRDLGFNISFGNNTREHWDILQTEWLAVLASLKAKRKMFTKQKRKFKKDNQ